MKLAEEKLIYSSAFPKETPFPIASSADDVVILVIQPSHPIFEVLNANGLTEAGKRNLIQNVLNYITDGCNYHYNIVSQIGNVYFCD